jgi:hypothetical protein
LLDATSIRRRDRAGIPDSRLRRSSPRADAADAVFEAEVIEAQRVEWQVEGGV